MTKIVSVPLSPRNLHGHLGYAPWAHKKNGKKQSWCLYANKVISLKVGNGAEKEQDLQTAKSKGFPVRAFNAVFGPLE